MANSKRKIIWTITIATSVALSACGSHKGNPPLHTSGLSQSQKANLSSAWAKPDGSLAHSLNIAKIDTQPPTIIAVSKANNPAVSIINQQAVDPGPLNTNGIQVRFSEDVLPGEIAIYPSVYEDTAEDQGESSLKWKAEWDGDSVVLTKGPRSQGLKANSIYIIEIEHTSDAAGNTSPLLHALFQTAEPTSKKVGHRLGR